MKFNWVLQCEPPLPLTVGNKHEFEKAGNRVFPLDTPIDLIDLDRQAVAKIRVLSFTNEKDKTIGVFEIIKVYIGDERILLSQYWKENQ